MHGPEKTWNFAEQLNKNQKWQSKQTNRYLNKMNIQWKKQTDFLKTVLTIFHKTNNLFGIFGKNTTSGSKSQLLAGLWKLQLK